jgi:hypothetical protein
VTGDITGHALAVASSGLVPNQGILISMGASGNDVGEQFP